MKFSLISATSIIALFSATAGPAHAGTLTALPDQLNIYDLVRDGVTSSDGGDSTVPRMDPAVSAVMALESATVNWQQSSSTGPVDTYTASGVAFPRIPLGAAPGTRPDADFATAITGSWRWNGWQKALAIGIDRIAPLIGTVGQGPVTDEKTSGTVFVAEGSNAGFRDASIARSSSVAVAFAPSSTSTATITVAGAGNFRQRGGNDFQVTQANSLQAVPDLSQPSSLAVVGAEAAQPTLGYNYSPTALPSSKPNAVEASFSDAVTAAGVFVQITRPVPVAKIQMSDATSNYAKWIDLTQPIEGKANDLQGDGTRSYLSASVSANPTTSAALYLADVVNATPVAPGGRSVEAFQIGPARSRGGAGTTVSDPLRGKVMASSGALNNSLALP